MLSGCLKEKMSDLKLYEEFVKSLSEEQRIVVKNKKSGSVYDINRSSFNSQTHTIPKPQEVEKAKEDAEDKAEDKGSSKGFSAATIKGAQEKLGGIDNILKDANDDAKERGKIVKDQFNKILTAKTEEEEVEAIQTLIDNNLIQGHGGGKKIYLSPNTLLPRKYLSGDGNALTKRMNDVISKHNLPIEMRMGSQDRELADLSGKHNEAGVVAYLSDNDKTKEHYKKLQERYREIGGGEEERFDEINRKTASMIKDSLPKGSKITGAEQVGGDLNRQRELGIDNKEDPTDYVIQYKDADGKDKIMKVSAKTYTDPNNITMKNSGVKNAGTDYLGKELGEEVDQNYQKLRKKYKWDDSMSEEKKSEMKTKLKEEYLKSYESAMVKLSKTEKGQEQLANMWKSVHGCGKDVHTQIINKKTGAVTIHPPDHYCNPGPPFKVKYNGTKMVVDVGGSEGDMEIVLKTEDTGSPKLLFKHVKKKKK